MEDVIIVLQSDKLGRIIVVFLTRWEWLHEKMHWLWNLGY